MADDKARQERLHSAAEVLHNVISEFPPNQRMLNAQQLRHIWQSYFSKSAVSTPRTAASLQINEAAELIRHYLDTIRNNDLPKVKERFLSQGRPSDEVEAHISNLAGHLNNMDCTYAAHDLIAYCGDQDGLLREESFTQKFNPYLREKCLFFSRMFNNLS